MRLQLFLIVLMILCDDISSESSESDMCPNVVAIVLARGGSRGIPMKNLVDIEGKSLLGRSLTVLHEARVFSEIWVSTDDDRIKDEARRYNASVHHRTIELSLDITPSIDVVQQFLKSNPRIQYVALIQCTSPFLTLNYLQSAVRKFEKSDCVFATTRSHKFRWRYDHESDEYRAVNFLPGSRPRRQDWDGELIETGMFYFAKRELVLGGVFQNCQCRIVEIRQEDALEIDDHLDLAIARFLIENQ